MVDRSGVVVLGATGSIGQSTCNVLRRHADRFRAVGFTAARRIEALDLLALEFEPDFVVLAGLNELGHACTWTGDWRFGSDALVDAATDEKADIVVNALVGAAGLLRTLAPWTAMVGRRARCCLIHSLLLQRNSSDREPTISAGAPPRGPAPGS